ncbi:MAG TPA: hypothetical protein VHB21_00290, partial [Minicystis sp.]|nr:hypothetical protein [Minicystis sp.]
MRLTVALALAVLGVAACDRDEVARVYDGGDVRVGRFISEYAYASFARGAEAEARGDLATAARAYVAAAD